MLVATGIIIINLYESGRARFISEVGYMWLFVSMQFAFGGLFGRFLIYYFRSSSLTASWPFLLILALLLLGNEFAKKYYTRLILQTGFLFLALFLYLIFLVPLALKQIGPEMFIISGVISLALITLFIKLLIRLVPERISDHRGLLRGIIILIFGVMNVLYFFKYNSTASSCIARDWNLS